MKRWSSAHHLALDRADHLVLLVGLLTGRNPQPAPATPSSPFTVDGASPGRTFDAVGAISGGGETPGCSSACPEPQRSELSS
ncbi:hypothetical protein [Streptomyces rimosus]|uniref:hypothetical protein n=1 Tax=Streptomyces rimosus TaxID=1927 RepID=UPI0004CBE1C8|nr:hypothetical protein [Streptomyces rimosus]